MTASRARAAGLLVFVAAALAFLHAVGSTSLAAPPLASPHNLGDWIHERDAVTATFALLRLAGIASGWYLLAGTLVQLLASLLRVGGLATLADRLSVPLVRHLAGALLGLGVTVAAASTPDASASGAAATMQRIVTPGEAVLRRLPPAGAWMTRLDDTTDSGDDVAVLERLPSEESDDPAPVPTTDTWVVEPGESFWAIADSLVAEALGRSPTDAEIVPYWQRLISANQDTLADPGNPDLLFPGQRLVVVPFT